MDDEMELIEELVEEFLEILDEHQASYAVKIAALEITKAQVVEDR